MAQRGEGQGLQIAVISFAMLTIILAITTYVFYAQSATAQKDLETKNKALSDQQAQNNKLLGRVAAMKYVLGVGGMNEQDVELAKSKAGEDTEIKEILDNFESDIALLGEQVAPKGTQSYRTFSTALLAALNKKNASVSDAIDQSRKAQQDKDAAEKAAVGRAEAAEASQTKAASDYKAESERFAADRVQSEEEKAKLNLQITAVSSRAKTDLQKVIDEKESYAKSNTQLSTTNRALLGRLDDKRKDEVGFAERADGHIKQVNQRQRMVWIDVGHTDGLLRQTTFSIYDQDQRITSDAKPKARIEVVNLGERISEARILEDTPRNPIINGDVIDTPAWSPGQRVHFALAMKMDINKDRIDDYEMVKNIIQMNGGVIDAELKPDGTRVGDITVNTRYFVQGERPSETTSPETQKKYNVFDEDRERFSVRKISVESLLALMGWKAEERTVEMSGSRGGGEFRKRSPGKTQPADKSAPASEAATPADSPAAPAAPASDPFAVPGGAAPTPAAPAAGDPFAPAAGADPFAPR